MLCLESWSISILQHGPLFFFFLLEKRLESNSLKQQKQMVQYDCEACKKNYQTSRSKGPSTFFFNPNSLNVVLDKILVNTHVGYVR